MRNYLLIFFLQIILGVTLNSQTRNLLSTYVYTTNTNGDTLSYLTKSRFFWDKTNCLDTLIARESVLRGTGKVFRYFRYKYDNQNRLKELSQLDSIFYYKNTMSDSLVLSRVNNYRQVYSYTPDTDIMYNETFNTTKQIWERTSMQFLRKQGTQNDTFQTALKTMIFDIKGNLILDVNRSSSGTNIDSSIFVYTNNVKTKEYLYKAHKLENSTIYTYKNNFLESSYTLTYYTLFGKTTVIDSTSNIYSYNNGLLKSIESHQTKYSLNNPPTVTATPVFKYLYEYDSKGNRSLSEYYNWSTTLNKLVLSTTVSAKYSPDSLKLDSIYRFYLSDGTLDSKYNVISYVYRLCQPLLSETQDISAPIDFTISPNPATGSVNLRIDESAISSDTHLSVYDLQGKIVYQSPIRDTQNNIDLSHIAKGFYLVKISNHRQSNVKKLILN